MNDDLYKLKIRQNYPLWMKLHFTKIRIKQWYDYWDGQVYVSFSGGKDSTVLLDIVRSMYPGVPAVFANTGREYKEIYQFIRTVDNVVWMKPKMKFEEVTEKYGYPVVSKKVAMGIDRYRNTKSAIQKELRINGGINPSSGKKQHRTIPLKWQFLLNAPFKISERCCDILKKEPFKRYEKLSNNKPLIGTMTEESETRKDSYMRNGGCNAFNIKSPKSTPLSFWDTNDVWDYINKYKITYSKIYDMGETRTGCVDCMFGVHLEKGENRFDRMKKTHPKRYKDCMERLGIKEVLDWVLNGNQRSLL